MTTKERLSRVALVLDTITEIRKVHRKAGRLLEKSCLNSELRDLEISTTIADVDERLDDIGRSEQDQA